ncbi:MAG: hypothetical protein O3B13_08150 [Planctomycetota bacterium]|nr:hypothetical protein [Planctomycetota bacterium]MDA1163058.1 hypothetical protein [Planctomycetota bacterium]
MRQILKVSVRFGDELHVKLAASCREEGMVDGFSVAVARRRETYEDLIAHEIG